MKNKIVFSISIFFIISIASLFFFPAQAENLNGTSNYLPTYFTYSEKDIQQLKNLNSSLTISEEQLKKWDLITQRWIIEHKIPYFEALRFFTYLYAVQRDAAFLSYNAHGCFEGSLEPISLAIAELFFPGFKKPENAWSDSYSEKLAAIIFPKYKERFKRENALEMRYKVVGEGGYNLPLNQDIAHIGSWIPWFVRPPIALLPPPPEKEDTKAWNKQIQELKSAQKNITEKQKQTIYFWAGLSGEGSGDLRYIANRFLFQNNVPLGKVILVRSVVTMALYDTCITHVYTKCHFAVMRPSVRDPSVKIYVAVPPHPSYPSGHSTETTVFKMIMTYYFPEEKGKWDRLAEEAGMSRIWGGIHYPIDHKGGQILGGNIGKKIIQQLKEPDFSEIQKCTQEVRAAESKKLTKAKRTS